MLSKILRVLYPDHCYLCTKPQSVAGLCQACQADLPLNLSCCQRCALPMPLSDGDLLCGDCLQTPPPFDKIWSPFIYGQPIEWMIQQLKFNHKLYIARSLARQMWRYKPAVISAECIIPLPLHPKRLKQRGFNQALELARELSDLSAIPIDDDICQRIVHTEAQTGQSARHRRRNIRGAFRYNKSGNGYRHVIVLDDVITTGSTVVELAKTLKQNGVERVDVWSVARAGRK